MIIMVIVILKQFILRTRLDCLILKMKALRFTETSLALYQMTRRTIYKTSPQQDRC